MNEVIRNTCVILGSLSFFFYKSIVLELITRYQLNYPTFIQTADKSKMIDLFIFWCCLGLFDKRLPRAGSEEKDRLFKAQSINIHIEWESTGFFLFLFFYNY